MSAGTQADERSAGVISAASEPEPEPAEAENGGGSDEAAASCPVPPANAGGKYGPVMRRRLKKFLAIVEEDAGWECVCHRNACVFHSLLFLTSGCVLPGIGASLDIACQMGRMQS